MKSRRYTAAGQVNNNMRNKLLFTLLYCVGASVAFGQEIRDAASPDYVDVNNAVNGGGPHNGVLPDGGVVRIPANVPTGSVSEWSSGQTVSVKRRISIIGAGPSLDANGKMTMSSTWGTKIGLNGSSAFVFNLTESNTTNLQHTARISGINFHFHAEQPVTKPSLAFLGYARPWKQGSTVRGGVRVDHIMWTADNKDAGHSYKYTYRGWIAGVMDHCFINYPNDGSWGFPGETGDIAFRGSPTGDATTPIGTPGGDTTQAGYRNGVWCWYGRGIPGHNIPNGNDTKVTDTDPRTSPTCTDTLGNTCTDTAGDVFYIEDNIWKGGGLMLDALAGGSRRVMRHNTMLGCLYQEHGNDTGGILGMHWDENYNNIFNMPDIATDGTNNGGKVNTWKIGNRGGFKLFFNTLWTGYNSASTYIAANANYVMNGNGTYYGNTDGTGFFDLNWNERLHGALHITPYGGTDHVYNPVPPLDSSQPPSSTFSGIANVPNDIRIGSVYAKSGDLTAHPNVPPAAANSSTFQVWATEATLANQWAGFQIRNNTLAAPVTSGGQYFKDGRPTSPTFGQWVPGDQCGNSCGGGNPANAMTNAMIFKNTSTSGPGMMTITVTGGNGSNGNTMRLGATDKWEIRYVKRYFAIQGYGATKWPLSGRDPNATGTLKGLTLLAKNGPNITASPTPGPSPYPSTPCTTSNTQDCNPIFPDSDDSQIFGTWYWSTFRRAKNANSFPATAMLSSNPLLDDAMHAFLNPDNTKNSPQELQSRFIDGGIHQAGYNSATGLQEGADANGSYPGYTAIGGLPNNSPYRRVGADWDGDTDASGGTTTYPCAGFTTNYHGANLTSWNVYGSEYPHPLTGAPSQPVFNSNSLNITPGSSDAVGFRVSASGNPLPTVTKLSGTLPSTIIWTPGGTNAGFGTITWANPVAAGAIPSLVFRANNGVGGNVDQPFTLTVSTVSNIAPVINSANSTSFNAGTAGNFAITVSAGTTPMTFGLAPGSTLPSTITVTANAGGTAGILASTTAAPAGTYNFTIRASNSAGNGDQPFTLTISSVQTLAVTLTAPADGTTYTAPATVALAATATGPNTISKVDFYNGSTLIGTDTTSPYTFSWTNVAAGSYTLKAIATDTAGTATSGYC